MERTNTATAKAAAEKMGQTLTPTRYAELLAQLGGWQLAPEVVHVPGTVN